jgi:tRNA(fMet)-specific endonuclease VapC
MKYALDSNIVSYFLKGNSTVQKRMQQEADNGHQFVIPLIVYYEVQYWLLKNNSKNKLSAFKELYSEQGLNNIDQILVDTALSIRLKLESQGKSIADSDLFIAAYCVANKLTLITNNTQHFVYIKELTICNWLEE